MKKLISVLLTVCAIAANTTTFAADVNSTITGSQNNKDSLVADSTQTAEMPCFKSGDILNFNVSNLNPGNQLTLISYKASAEDLSNSTVQYINQYTLGNKEDTKPIEYKIRDIEDGIYKIVLNGNDGNAVATFYYKVGETTVSMVTQDETSYYISEEFNGKYSIAFVGSATKSSSELTFADTGINTVGFKFTSNADSTKTETYELTAEQLLAAEEAIESEGSVTLYYGVTMYNLNSLDDANNFSVETSVNATSNEGGNAQ